MPILVYGATMKFNQEKLKDKLSLLTAKAKIQMDSACAYIKAGTYLKDPAFWLKTAVNSHSSSREKLVQRCFQYTQ